MYHCFSFKRVELQFIMVIPLKTIKSDRFLIVELSNEKARGNMFNTGRSHLI